MKYLAGILLFFQSLLGIQQVQMPSQPVVHHIKIKKPNATPALGGVIDTTATIIPLSAFSIPQSATSSLDTVASSLSVLPSISVSGKTVTISAFGIYDACSVYFNKLFGFSFSTNQIVKKTFPSGNYPFTFICAMTGKQSGSIQSTITIP